MSEPCSSSRPDRDELTIVVPAGLAADEIRDLVRREIVQWVMRSPGYCLERR